MPDRQPAGARFLPQTVDVVAVSKRFGSAAALDDIGLHVDPGTFLVLLGPSGSGKTTLVRCIAGIEHVGSGAIAIGGRTVAGPKVHVAPEHRALAMVFQDYALWPHMTVRRNVAFALRRLALSRAEADRRADTMLERVGLGRLGHRYPNELSGGEQQRVALARALVAGLGLLLFDEPLSNLDADLREQLRLEIATLTRESGATSIYITHDQSEAFALADQIGVLREGRLVQIGTPEAIYRDPRSSFVARFTGVAGELVASDPRLEAHGRASVVLAHGGMRRVEVAAPAGVPGGQVAVYIRPSGARLQPPGTGHLAATVRDVAFCGRGYEHAVDLPGGSRLTRLFDERRFARGSNVGIVLDPRGCVLLPAEPLPAEPLPAEPLPAEPLPAEPLVVTGRGA